MNLLLDTQALLWWRTANQKLGRRARLAIDRDAASVRISAATAWEIAIKTRAGRLTLPKPLHVWMPSVLEDSGFEVLTVTIDHASTRRRTRG